MRIRQRIAGAFILLVVLAIGVLLTYRVRSERTEVAESVAEPTSDLNKWDIHEATDGPLPASGYMLFFQEAKSCNGATVIKQTGSNWRLGIAWYDNETKALTDVIKRDELVQILGKYLDVDRTGLNGVRRAVENKAPEMYVGTVSMSAESVWFQLDPESCGVRSGWLVYRHLTSDKVTRQKISW